MNKSNELIVIDIKNLKQLDRFILLEDSKYEEIINSTKNKKEQLNLLKLLLYFKYKLYKPQNTITITKEINISNKKIYNYINKLKQLNLI